MKLNPYLAFDGQCREAFEFYEQTSGGKIAFIQTIGESPSVALHVDTAADGERVFNALAGNGKVQMPFQPTFWAEGFGMAIDRFGIPWIVSAGG